MAITQTIWKIDSHTKIKHDILRKYLNAWIPILSKFKKINYIDGFAGPGKYSLGEDGSPLIAIKAICEHKLKVRMGPLKINFLLIEKDQKRCENLEAEMNNFKKFRCSGCNIECNHKTVCGKFEEVTKEIFDFLENNNSKIAPSFVFIDPFGFSGLPMEIIRKIMAYPHCEVLITFMYDEISRFFNLEINDKHLTLLFGTNEWKSLLDNKGYSPEEKKSLLRELYQRQLKESAGITYVHSFLMINRFNKPDYFLFFGTNEKLGLIKMKNAMRKSDKTGAYAFSDITYDPHQTKLYNPEPNYNLLKKILLEKYRRESTTMKELVEFVNLNTSFIEVDLRKHVLTPLEKSKEIEVTNRIKAGSYPSECVIRFK